MLLIKTLKKIVNPILISAILIGSSCSVFAVSLADISSQDASSGLKAALEQGASAAVARLGVENGFMKGCQNISAKCYIDCL